MRLKLTLGLLILPMVASAQVWEKYVAPGLTYRMEVDLQIPRILHGFRFTPGNPAVQALPELAEGTVYSETPVKGRETLTSMVRRTGAIAGINADFFPFTGDPLGMMVREGELLSLPDPRRAVFAWGEALAVAGRGRTIVTMEAEGRSPIELNGFNQEAGVNEVVLNTEFAGMAVAQKGETAHLVLRRVAGETSPMGVIEAEVQYVLSNAAAVPVQPGNMLLSASGNKIDIARALPAGHRVRFRFSTDGFDWSQLRQAVGGGPFLVQRGALAVDATVQGFDAAFTTKRHPRTAVGRTAAGDVWFVTVDGRQTISAGATLDEMARIMRRLGCVDAINLDGGGSTTINAFGSTLNRPSDGKERPVANAVLFYGPPVVREEAPLKLLTPPILAPGDTLTLKVLRDTGEVVPTGEVFWQSSGSGWVDQGGFLRVIAPGTIWVSAVVRGSYLSAAISVEVPSRLDRGNGAEVSRAGTRSPRPAPAKAAQKAAPAKKAPAKKPLAKPKAVPKAIPKPPIKKK